MIRSWRPLLNSSVTPRHTWSSCMHCPCMCACVDTGTLTPLCLCLWRLEAPQLPPTGFWDRISRWLRTHWVRQADQPLVHRVILSPLPHLGLSTTLGILCILWIELRSSCLWRTLYRLSLLSWNMSVVFMMTQCVVCNHRHSLCPLWETEVGVNKTCCPGIWCLRLCSVTFLAGITHRPRISELNPLSHSCWILDSNMTVNVLYSRAWIHLLDELLCIFWKVEMVAEIVYII